MLGELGKAAVRVAAAGVGAAAMDPATKRNFKVGGRCRAGRRQSDLGGRAGTEYPNWDRVLRRFVGATHARTEPVLDGA